MKIRLRGFVHPDTAAELVARGSERMVGPFKMSMFFDCSWPGDGLREFLDTFRDLPRVDFNVWMEFTKKELAASRYLLMRPSKVIRDSEADFERTRRYIDSLPWLGDNPQTRYRLTDRVYLSRFRLAPNQIAAAGEWSAEFVAHEAAYNALAGCGLTGLDQRPVIDTASGLPNPTHVMLYTSHVLPERILDLTCPRFNSPHPEERGYERLGHLCYSPDVLDAAPDFNRAGENFVSFEFPEWVVSNRVAACFRDKMLRGLRFEPVLEDLTPAYNEYLSLWGSLYDAMSDGLYTIRMMRPWEQAE